MKMVSVCGAVLLGLLACAGEDESVNRANQANVQPAAKVDAAEAADLISFYRLIARAEDYDGKAVLIFGYLEVSQQYNAAYLYPTAEAMDRGMIVDKLVLILSDERWLQVRELNSRYVSVMGVFHVKTQPKGEYIEFGRLEPTMRLVDMQRD